MNLLYGALCLAYVLTMSMKAFPGQETIKAAPILLLAAVIARSTIQPRLKRTLVIAFLFSAAGDIFLHLDIPMSFLLGLGSFLVGHLFFIATNVRWPHFKKRRLVLAALVVGWLVLMMALIRPGAQAQGLFLPTLVYGAALASMAITSFFADARGILAAGGLLFVVSDSVIAWSRFVAPLPASGYVIMLCYYGSQFCLAKGYLASHRASA